MQEKSLSADDLLLKTIKKNSPMVYRLAFSLVKSKCDADDIHQEVFIRYITKQPLFESKEHEKAWFIKVTANFCKNWWKTAWRRKVISLSEYEEAYEEDALTFGRRRRRFMTVGGGEEECTIIDVVKILPQKYRVVIHLFYYEEMSVEEIAGILDLNPSTVRTRLTRARRKLGEILKEGI